MFQAVPLPIIRSSKLYAQHRVFVELLLLPTACVSDLGLDSSPKSLTQAVGSSKSSSPKSLMQAVGSSKSSTNTRCYVYSFELLMMGGGTA